MPNIPRDISSPAMNWLKRAYMADDITPIFDQEFIYITAMEFAGPGGACSAHTEWEEVNFTQQIFCQRAENHTGDHVSLMIPKGETFSNAKIKRRWPEG